MIKVEPCRGCGRSLFIHPIANLTVRLEIEPLDAAQATQALLGGKNLWRVTQTSVSGVRPAELTALAQAEPGERPHVCQEHRCAAVSRPDRPSPVQEVNPAPKGRQAPLVAVSTQSSVRSTTRSFARPAVSRRSEPCDACRKPVELDGPEEYAAVELGATVMWVQHAVCPAA